MTDSAVKNQSRSHQLPISDLQFFTESQGGGVELGAADHRLQETLDGQRRLGLRSPRRLEGIEGVALSQAWPEAGERRWRIEKVYADDLAVVPYDHPGSILVQLEVLAILIDLLLALLQRITGEVSRGRRRPTACPAQSESGPRGRTPLVHEGRCALDLPYWATSLPAGPLGGQARLLGGRWAGTLAAAAGREPREVPRGQCPPSSVAGGSPQFLQTSMPLYLRWYLCTLASCLRLPAR